MGSINSAAHMTWAVQSHSDTISREKFNHIQTQQWPGWESIIKKNNQYQYIATAIIWMLRIWIEYNFDGWNSPYTIHKTSVVYPGLKGFLTSFPSNSSLLPLCSSILFEEKSNENLGPGYQSSQSYVPHTLFTSQLISTGWYLLSVWCSFWWIGGTPLRKCFSSENCLYCLIGRQSTSQRNGESIHDDEKKNAISIAI